MSKILLITPPFTQLNTPYPATAVLKGFLNTKNIPSFQVDLGLEVILELFSRKGLTQLFKYAESVKSAMSDNAQYIYNLQDEYISSVESAIQFLQSKNPTLSYKINQRSFLPEASRFNQISDLDVEFGSMGLHDKARYLVTLFIEDICDFITECVDSNFGLSRYAEQLGRSANDFGELYEKLKIQQSFIDTLTLKLLGDKLKCADYSLVVISIPFAGNLFGALRCGQFIKEFYPELKVVMGGGFANTELRSLTDKRVFEFTDYIALDDGELPIELIYKDLDNSSDNIELKRTFILDNGNVKFIDNSEKTDYLPKELPAPDYTDLMLDKYISVIEVVNPMHSLWSNGRWNKMAMAHGCYWGKCTFCDCSLDYIGRYSPDSAVNLVDKVEKIIEQTGESGFHFIDEAAPPALMRDFALEVIKRRLQITWWTNIRFEKSFTADLCFLLSESGCVAVSGGIEVASDRLLKLINKGVTLSQVAGVTRNFAESGIMVHAYLMYGFPTQTEQETIDSLEMVRQMFEIGLLKSAFWHQFALTAHSPVSKNPEKYDITPHNTDISFAHNDVQFTHNSGINHDKFSFGLKKAVYNYMHGIGFGHSIDRWFDSEVPPPSVNKHFIENSLGAISESSSHDSQLVWIGGVVKIIEETKKRKGKLRTVSNLIVFTKQSKKSVIFPLAEGKWLHEVLLTIHLSGKNENRTLSELKSDYEQQFKKFETFWDSKPMEELKQLGLLSL